MFSSDVVDSDRFLDMPTSSRCLYYELGMRADDDGFISPKKVLRLTGASDDDLRVLIAKGFLIPFDSGVIVIKDWKINNYLRNDRHSDTIYTNERSMLGLNENNSYVLVGVDEKAGVYEGIGSGIPDGRHLVDSRYPQYSIGKYSIGKDRGGEEETQNPPEKKVKRTVKRNSEEWNMGKLRDGSITLELMKEYEGVDIKKEIEKMINYLDYSGKRYKNLLAFARNWIMKDGAYKKTEKSEKVSSIILD